MTIGIGVFLAKDNKTRNIQEDTKIKTPSPSPYAISTAFCSNCGASSRRKILH